MSNELAKVGLPEDIPCQKCQRKAILLGYKSMTNPEYYCSDCHFSVTVKQLREEHDNKGQDL